MGCLALRELFDLPRVAVIDYSVGNLFSIRCALRRTGLDVNIISTSQGLRNIDAVVVLGVGNFKAGLQSLKVMRQDIHGLVEGCVPLLGVCLGMQLLFEESEESPGEGLGLVRGRVLRLPKHVKAPHMGWNTLMVSKPIELLDGVDEEDHFYFAHSYYPSPLEKGVIVAETEYGLSFASVIAKGNVYGVQFHPEKSGRPGEGFLRNFAKIVKR